MRSLVALLGIVLAACASPAASQVQTPVQAQAPSAPTAYRGPDLQAQRTAMARLAPLIGRWAGEANVTAPHPMIVHQTERVESDLDGLVLVIHGTGYANADHSGQPIFQAMAVASFDDRRGLYEFRSYTRGFATTATGEFLPDGSFQWSINPGGPVRMRYTIVFDQNTWRETGEMSNDGGTTWRPTIEMNLRRV